MGCRWAPTSGAVFETARSGVPWQPVGNRRQYTLARHPCKRYAISVIASFAAGATADLFHGVDSARVRRWSPDVQKAARRKLDMVNAAAVLDDLKVPPGNKLEALRGDLKGYHSIRVNDQWRVVFKWKDGAAYEVRITDYH
jgi:proteic killer suppression protein